MLIIQDLYDVCKKEEKSKKIFLVVKMKDNKMFKVPMVRGHYIVDSIWCSQVYKETDNVTNIIGISNDDFISEMEQECMDYPNDWGDLYISPIDDLCSIELGFYYDIVNGYDNGLTHFEGTEIKEDEENIYIYIKEK